MNAPQTRPIVVGVDNSPASRDAVRWAAEEASRADLPLTLVHAGFYLYEPALSEATASLAVAEMDQYARTLIRQAEDLVREIDPAIAVHSILELKAPANLLISLSHSAGMLVLGSHAEGSISGLIFGSISQTVTAHARCPVVIVNSDGPVNAERRNVVVVGISPSEGGQQALRFAFEQARRRECSLLAVRSWGALGSGSIALTDAAILQDLQSADSRVMDLCLEQVARDFADVAVQRELVAVRPQWALEESAIGAELLVVGCHRRDDHWFSRLGPVASWLLHRSPCPIAVVGRPPNADSVMPGSAVPAGTVTHDQLASPGPELEKTAPGTAGVIAPVVVGIDGTPDGERVLRWGIEQALIRSAPLRLVTAYRWALSYPWELVYNVRVSELEELRHEAGHALKQASELVTALQPDLAVTTEAIEGSPVAVLLDESRHASMLVLGSRQPKSFGAVTLGSVATAVSARAQCPVIVLRGPVSSPIEDTAVVVGIDATGHSEAVLGFGFDYASRNGLPVTAILCWKRDRIAAPWRPTTPSTERAESWLTERVEGWREKYPNVTVRTAVIDDDAVPGLVANSIEQSLLVVGTRGRHALTGTLLGSVSQGVLHHALCPVAVVPSHAT